MGASPTAALPVTPYDFPVDPGTPEWSTLATHAEMLAATQIPPHVLNPMPTADLVATVLDYPMFLDMYAFNSPQRGFDIMASRFNGIGELYGRPDAAEVMAQLYGAQQETVAADSAVLTEEGHATRLAALEMLLAQKAALAALDETDLATLLQVATDRLESLNEFPEVYGPSGEETTLLLAGRIQYLLLGSDWDTNDFLATGLAASAEVLADVEAAVVSHAVIPEPDGLTASERDYNGTVKTPNGSSVPVLVMTYGLSSTKIADYNRYVARNYPSATRETNASRKYNCHSYAWYSQSTSNTRWMNSPGDDRYWTDGRYRLWHTPLVAKYNTRGSYVNGDHSALKFEKGGRIVHSKWGQLPRMMHDQWYSPYVDDRLDFYYRTGT